MVNMKNVIGIVNFHTSPELSPLTDSRPIGSTSFLGRYALVDFALSNFCNSGISNVGVLIKNHQRSILKHLGSMDSWVKNTKIGKMSVMINEDAISGKEANTDLNNIRANDWILYDTTASYVVIAPAHILASIDFRPILEEHIANHDKITLIATMVENPSKAYLGEEIIHTDKEGFVTDVEDNDGHVRKPSLCSMDAMIINRTILADMMHQYGPRNPLLDLKTLMYRAALEENYRVRVYEFKGYSRCFDSFKHYMDYSNELLDKETFDGLFHPDWPIYTLTHDTPPAIYGEDADVSNSFIANGSVIEGTVINSIISRNVKIAKGAVVKNSIIFSTSKIGEGAVVENALVDKYAIVTRSHNVCGKEDDPLYIGQGVIL